MISKSYNFTDFLQALNVEDRDYLDVIYMAEQEATAAERMLYKPRNATEVPFEEVEKYANTVKHFIWFMRYGIKPAWVDNEVFELFRSVCTELAEKGRLSGRCSNLA